MEETTRTLEELSFRTLPAIDQERFDGWVLRWSAGGSRRGNSVNPLAISTLPLESKIRSCESWFAARRARPVFRLTDLADAPLADLLAAQGYLSSSPTAVMTAPVVSTTRDPNVVLGNKPDDEWLRAVAGKASEVRLAQLRDQLTSSGGDLYFAAIGAAPAAIGLGIALDSYLTIYNMNTAPPERRQGHARRILSTLFALGADVGCTRAVLQVTLDNEPALELYRGAGFSQVYTYYYLAAPGS